MTSVKPVRFRSETFFYRSRIGANGGLSLIEVVIALAILLGILVGSATMFKTYISGGSEAMLIHRQINLAEYIANQTDHSKTFPNIPYCTVGSYVQVRDLNNQILIKSDHSSVLNGMKVRARCTHTQTGEFHVEVLHVDASGNPRKMPHSGKISEWTDLYDGIPLVKEKCARNSYLGKTYKLCSGPWSFSEASSKCPHLGMVFVTVTDEAENSMITQTALDHYGCSTTYPFMGFWIGNAKPASSATWTSGSRIYNSREPTGDGPRIQMMRYCEAPSTWNDLAEHYPNGAVCKVP